MACIFLRFKTESNLRISSYPKAGIFLVKPQIFYVLTTELLEEFNHLLEISDEFR